MGDNHAFELVQASVSDGCDCATALEKVAQSHARVARFLGGDAGAVASAIAEAVSLAAELAKAGDPAGKIERIRDVAPLLDDMRSRWEKRKRDKLES